MGWQQQQHLFLARKLSNKRKYQLRSWIQIFMGYLPNVGGHSSMDTNFRGLPVYGVFFLHKNTAHTLYPWKYGIILVTIENMLPWWQHDVIRSPVKPRYTHVPTATANSNLPPLTLSLHTHKHTHTERHSRTVQPYRKHHSTGSTNTCATLLLRKAASANTTRIQSHYPPHTHTLTP